MLSFHDTVIFRMKVAWLLFVIFILALLFFSSAANALNTELLQNYSNDLDKIEKTLKRHRFNEKRIPDATKEVTKIKLEVTQCISDENSKVERLKKDLDSLGKPLKTEPVDVKQKRYELETEISNTEKLLASCRVFLLRTEETLKKLTEEQQNLLSERLFAKSENIKQLVLVNWNKPSLWLKSTQHFILNDTGLALLSSANIMVLVLIVLLSLAVGLIVRKQIDSHIKKKMMHDTFSNHFSRSFLAVTAFYTPHLLISLTTALFCYLLTSKVTPVPFISVIAYGLPIYFSLVSIVEIFLDPRKPALSFHGWPENVARQLAQRLKVFLLLMFIGYLLFTTLLTQSLPEETLLLSRSLFILVFVINLVWAVQLLGRIPRFADTFAIRFGTNIVLLSILITELLGYRNLSSYVIVAVFGTLLTVGLFILISLLLKELFEGLEHGRRKWQRYIRDSLGVQARKKLPELAWIRFILTASLWLISLAAILRIWGLSDAGFQQINIILTDGFTVGSLDIVPARILLAIIVLTVLLAVSRWLRARLEQKWLLRTNIERGAREAVATVSGYVGVALAIIISLSITGVEFGNLAIIAGALSVGIGFGLQNIVNNFVSGLILLFERPIKTGDWIVVGNTEGFVKRISIRSTQIQTFDQADVIVPNSDLISGQVTNWMLRDVRGRIRVPVGVAYGSDTKLVERLLLEVAQNNPSVVKDGSRPEPTVLFMSFGDSALLFELRVFIKSIDERFKIHSDINFSIDTIFREHNIQIPFPQRDLHIKSEPGNKGSKTSEND
jgi:small-conductance mechanosensitive channel